MDEKLGLVATILANQRNAAMDELARVGAEVQTLAKDNERLKAEIARLQGAQPS